MKRLLSLILAVIMLTGVTVMSVAAAEQRVVNVSTPEALIAALASDTKIVLAPGKYVIRAEEEKIEFSDGEVWTFKNPKCVDVENISNLTIEGNGKAEVVLDVGTAPVIKLSHSENITISGLILGHDVPEYGCEGEGYVIAVNESQNVTVNGCDLYGCGVNGINAWRSGNIVVNNTTIRDCMMNAVEGYSMKGDMTFNDCKFLRNAYDDLYAQTSPCIRFNIYLDEGDYGTVHFNRCLFEGNLSTEFKEVRSYSGSAYADIPMTLNECVFTGNEWETAIKVKIAQEDYSYNCYFADQRPIILEGRTMIPVRGLLENLGYDINWDDATKTVIIKSYMNDDELRVTVGSNVIYKNGEAITIDVPATIMNGRTMIPVRAIVEAFGYKIEWNESERTVTVYES